MKVLGVADINPQAPGLVYAAKLNLFATTNFEELYDLVNLNLLIELTGSEEVREAILRTKPTGISIMDHRGARFLWNLIQMEMEKTKLEKNHHAEEEKEKRHKQVILDSLPYRVMVVNEDMTISTVNPPVAWISPNSSMISRSVSASRLLVGSSASSTRGRLISARAITTRCCCPAESWRG